MRLLASTIPLIWKTCSLCILKKLSCFLHMSFQIIYFNCEQGIFYSNFFLLNIYFYKIITVQSATTQFNTNFAEIFKNMVSAHSTFISLLIYATIPTILSPFSNIHPIQIIHTSTTTTPTIPTILSRNPFNHIIGETLLQTIQV